MHYRGLTWDHPRGYRALRIAAERFNADPRHSDTLSWEVHPLEGFESAPIDRIIAKYDLVVLDHPHLGDALSVGALQAVSSLAGRVGAKVDASDFIGPSVRSYTVEGQVWALPLDAAAQVAAYDASRISEVPRTWDEVESLSNHVPVSLGLAGPHALLTLYALCAAMGNPASASGELPEGSAAVALERMQKIASRMRPEWLDLNPIAIHERISARADIAYCPLVYGYINYAGCFDQREDGSWPVKFADAPRMGDGPPGSVIGGTGLAVSSGVEVSSALVEHLIELVDVEAQCGSIVAEGGQPSRTEAWYSELVDKASGGFCSATRATLESSWIRPRFPGYTAFQLQASNLMRSVVLGETSIVRGLQDYEELRARTLRPS
jgi:multiple sugar transport system substrate-binding protein